MQAQPSPYERRLVDAVLASVKEKGYAATTIADVVRHAGVSKRTFYEVFPDKEAAFLAAYFAASEQVVLAIGAAAAAMADRGWEEQMRAATRAYLTALESEPALTRTFLSEIHAAGPRALEARRVVHQRYADMLRALVDGARASDPSIRPLSSWHAVAIVGGINELVLVAVEKGRAGRLRELEEATASFVAALLLPSPAAGPRRPSKR
jgi:AcrR family transcriptional regulator